jgi:hypothetical protein
MARRWYSYVVPSSDPRLASSYQLMTAPPLCTVGPRLCAIYAEFSGLFPLSPISVNLQQYIATALANGTPQPLPGSGSRYYVYVKP